MTNSTQSTSNLNNDFLIKNSDILDIKNKLPFSVYEDYVSFNKANYMGSLSVKTNHNLHLGNSNHLSTSPNIILYIFIH